MYLGISTKETIKNDLENMFNMDADFSGDNGEEYICDEAREEGFKNNAAYFANKSYNKYKNTMDMRMMIYEMFGYFKRIEGNYWKIELETLPLDESLIVALSARPINQG